MPANGVSVQGRATQGVRVMRVEDGEKVVSVETLADPSDEENMQEETPDQSQE